jgi:hypothetical protein
VNAGFGTAVKILETGKEKMLKMTVIDSGLA